MARDVGAMGESEFSKLCSAVGITPNTVHLDKNGWDSIVQFPMSFSDSLDLTQPPIKAFVQVKATDDRKKKTQHISLLNMLHFVKDSSPCFLCQISFDGHDSAQRIYLMHVGEEVIREVLNMIRSDQDTDGFRLNKRKFPVRFKKENLLQEADGASLKRKIESHVPEGMGVYTQNKSRLTNSVGYEEGNVQGTFAVRCENPAKALLDLSLGIVEQVDIEDFTLFEKRFGICSTQPIIRSESGKLLTEKVAPIGLARLKFSDSPHGPGVFFDAHWYASSLNAFVGQEDKKFRIASQLMELITQPFKQSALVNLFPNYRGEKIKLLDLKKIAELIQLFNSSTENLHISIELFSEALERELNVKNPTCIKGFLTTNDSFEAKASLAGTILDTFEVARRYGIQGSVEMCLYDFNSNETRIREFHDCVINNSNRWFKIQFGPKMDECERQRIEGSDRVGCITSIRTSIGQYKLICIFVILGDKFTRCIDERLELLSLETDYHRYLVFQDSDLPTEEQFEAEFAVIAAQLNADGITAIRLS